ncbi:hypothetical protein [Chryseobacterium taihuense]|uniref:Uncharacterized protein n=1 Tax=Chryseobacterium taihuense TaxID=1141221 RepID=A0ABY0QZ80_9FLAO|nr:hypothetical protein [Chryseobacterium taihuense]SDM14643.1 hypothetical protein SAMN05216273_11494 [Chryseobacterium taihuense]
MFNFFKKQNTRSHFFEWELDLLSKIFDKLGNDYLNYKKQIQDGILSGIKLYDQFPNYVGFRFNTSILQKYEDKSVPESNLSNIKVFNKNTSNYQLIKIKLGYGLILGYEIDNRDNFIPDFNYIEINEEKEIIQSNNDFNEIANLFTEEERNLINQSEVYPITLNNKKYYHLYDLEDGDFIGMDESKEFYKITHDPFNIKLLSISLHEIKKTCSTIVKRNV